MFCWINFERTKYDPPATFRDEVWNALLFQRYILSHYLAVIIDYSHNTDPKQTKCCSHLLCLSQGVDIAFSTTRIYVESTVLQSSGKICHTPEVPGYYVTSLASLFWGVNNQTLFLQLAFSVLLEIRKAGLGSVMNTQNCTDASFLWHLSFFLSQDLVWSLF